jgi:murein L,D-transpeptidase YcbB/YkuD
MVAVAILLSGCNVRFGSDGESAAADDQSAGWNNKAAEELRAALNARAAHGLDRMQFDATGDAGTAEGRAALARTALAYATALSRGATDPKKLYEIYTVDRPEADLKRGLAEAMQQNRLGAWLASLAPQDPAYKALSRNYLALRQQPAQPQGAPVIPESGEPIKPGATDPRIPRIARQLVILDYLPNANGVGNRYTPALVAAVKAMQADYGVKPDGVIGADALQVLNLSDEERARAIAVTMERMRWLEREPPATRIDVNVAAAKLSYFRDNKLVDSRKVVVGEPDNETPQLGSPIYRLVANPTWTIPKSIEEREFANKDPAEIEAQNITRKDGWLVQEPGPKNALGLVKFDMVNDHAIYLHDTPAKALFGQVQRQRSHGCVRVEDALGFAEMLARDEGVMEEWQRARATGEETFVPIKTRIPVRMLYHTVLFGDDGEPIIRNDPYGWNDRVAQALGFAKAGGIRVRTGGNDVGP